MTIFTRSDDYKGYTLTNPTIPEKFRYMTKKAPVIIKRHSIVGANSVIFPGVTLEERTSGAMNLVAKSTEPWGIYVEIPARRVNNKRKDLLEQEVIYLKEFNSQE